MRNIAFSMTKDQVRARTKDVTRRVGWAWLKPGTLLRGVEKGMGLKKGEKVKELATIRVVDVRRERLDLLVDPALGDYGADEMRREGFPGLDPQDFMLRYLCSVDPDALITRIEFEYVERTDMNNSE